MAVITATLVAISVALATALSGGGPNQVDGFDEIRYTRDVEHNQLALLGGCPLEREIIIQKNGKARLSWYAQITDQHGCVRAIGFASDLADEERWDEPKVARIERMLSPANLHRLVEMVGSLSWGIEWTALENLRHTYPVECGRGAFRSPDRKLIVLKAGNPVTALPVNEEQEIYSASCIIKKKASTAALDTAFASFSLLPSRYDIRPEVAGRLHRNE